MRERRRTMRMTFVSVVVVATALSLQAGDATRIYVYAQRDTPAHSWLRISCGDIVVAELKQGTFFAINVEPGRYTLFVENGAPVSVDANSGRNPLFASTGTMGSTGLPSPRLRMFDRPKRAEK